ncbi:acyltransferase family protein [Burkholderia sp. PU8-34]
MRTPRLSNINQATLPKNNEARGRGMKKTNVSLEGVRGAAALLVVIYHMGGELPGLNLAPAGYLSVDLFFVLSGFVICQAYGDRISDGSQWCNFMLRRFGRLFPAQLVATAFYYALLNVLIVAAHVIAAPAWPYVVPTPGEALAIATMTQGLPLFDHYVGLPVTWSTSCEFCVYMLFGALCLTVRGHARTATFLTLSICGYAVAVWASLVPAGCLTRGECLSMTYDYGLARCIAGFFIGTLIAAFRDRPAVVAFTRPLTQMLALALVVILIWASGVLNALALLSPLAFAVLVAALSSDNGPVARLFSRSGFRWLGAMSYAVYLAHDMFRSLLHGMRQHVTGIGTAILFAAIFLASSYIAAHMLHKYVEVPWRARFYGWADRLRRRVPHAVAD